MKTIETDSGNDISNENIIAHGVIATDKAFIGEPSSALKVNWALTKMCNYNCSYCFGHTKLDKSKFSSPKDLINAARLILDLDRSQYWFTLSGGEPTIHPGFFDLQDVIFESKKPVRVHVITNGSRGPKFFDRWVSRSNEHNLSVSLSFHTEHADFGKIREIVEILSFSSINTHISLMFHPEMKDTTEKIHQYLCALREKAAFRCKILTLREGAGHAKVDSRYSKNDLEWVDHCNKSFLQVSKNANGIPRKSGKSSIAFPLQNICYVVKTKSGLSVIPANEGHLFFRKGLKNFANFSCCSGLNLININSSGQFRGAVCSLARYSQESLFDMESLPQKDIVRIIKCTLPGCGCVSNDNIPKFRHEEMAKRYIKEKYFSLTS